uniref:Ammonium transporter AmtB-like domain-containing protein n=1 Tax=Meloidogyne incognita TaxID=6306 RepID=A0A914L9Y9_MELIC
MQGISMSNTMQRRQFSVLACVFQSIFVALFAIFGEFHNHEEDKHNRVHANYPMFQDIHTMKYGLSALSINLLLCSFVMQYALLLRGFLSPEFLETGLCTISIDELVQADLSCVTVLITMGVLLGRLTPVQFLVLAFLETSITVLLEHLLYNVLFINDAGRSLVVHCFGAYFGLAAAKVCHRQNTMVVDDDESSGHSSELFAMLAKAACTTATFMLSSLADHLGRFNMAHIQSSSLAGGIAIGAFANVILYPHHAIVVGAAAALISVVGHVFVTPKILEKRLSIQDTCGAHSLHGLPSLLAGFLSALFVLLYEPSEYGPNFVEQYRAIYPQWKGSGQPGAHRDLRTQCISMSNTMQRRQFSVLACVFQSIFVALFAIFGEFHNHEEDKHNRVHANYPMFQDIHTMVIIGFGFLLSFLKKYGLSALSINLLLCSFVMQYALLLRGFLSPEFLETGLCTISIDELVQADLSCVTVLITMGVLLGRLTPVQFLVLAFLETSITVLLEHLLYNVLFINDAGRSLVVHCFGAYFGLAAAKVCHRQNTMVVDDDESSGHSSELFAMLGTLFIWSFFPSFNAGSIPHSTPEMRHRAFLNSYLAMAACTTATFMLSSLADHLGRFNMAHIQSSSLAGGIAIGAFANVILYPHHAIVVGAAAALISVVGHVFVTPKILEKRLSIQDTCGAHSLHGLPSLLAGFLSALFVLLYEPSEYGPNFVEQYSAIYPQWKGSGQPGAHRDLRTQSFFQLAGLGLTFLTAIFGGLFCGWVMNWSLLNQVQPKPSYEDASYYLNAEFSLFGNLDNSGHGLGSSNASIHKCGRIDYRPLDIEAALRAVKRAGIGPDAIF